MVPLRHGGWWRPLVREKRCRLTGAMVVLVAGFSRAAFAEGAGPQVRAFLTTLGFSEAQSVSVQAGRVAVRVLKDAEDSQVTVAGAVHVRAPMQRLLGDTSELWALMAVGDRLRTGSFADPPRLEDLEALVFDPRDLEGVPGCEPRDCSLKLDDAGMRIVKRVSWRAPGAYARFGALLKEWMLGAVEAYRRDGELPIYLDKRRTMSVAEAMNRSVSESPYIDARSPFLEHVLGTRGHIFPTATTSSIGRRRSCASPSRACTTSSCTGARKEAGSGTSSRTSTSVTPITFALGWSSCGCSRALGRRTSIASDSALREWIRRGG